jgi:hypothetical protein
MLTTFHITVIDKLEQHCEGWVQFPYFFYLYPRVMWKNRQPGKVPLSEIIEKRKADRPAEDAVNKLLFT